MKERFRLDTGFKGHKGTPIYRLALAVSADGKLALAMGGAGSGNVQVWDLEQRKKLFQYDSLTDSAAPVAISPDGKTGVFGNGTQDMVLIDLTTGKELRKLKRTDAGSLSSYFTGLTFSPGGDLLIVASDREIIGWDTATGSQRFAWKEPGAVRALSPMFDDGRKIASTTDTGIIEIWDLATGKVVQTFGEEGKPKITALFLASGGQQLGAADTVGFIRIWDLTTGKVVKDLKGNPAPLCSMDMLPDHRTLLYNGAWKLVVQDTITGEMKTFAENTGKEIRQFPVAVTPDGSTLLSGESEKIVVWDVRR